MQLSSAAEIRPSESSLVQIDFGGKPKDPKGVVALFGDALGRNLLTTFQEWEQARDDIEQNWLEDMRAYYGIYEAKTRQKIDQNRSDVFVHLTRTKVQAAYARLIDIYLGQGKRFWDMSPTPIPEMIFGGAAIDPGTGQQYPVPGPRIKELMSDITEEMSLHMEDQFVELDFETKFKQAILEQCLLGTGCLKGATVEVKNNSKWHTNANGKYELFSEEKPFPGVYAPSIFDVYPDPFSLSVDDATGIFERHIMSHAKVAALKGHPGFDANAIDDVLRQYPNGNHTMDDHERERRFLAGYLNSQHSSKRYEVLEYWGFVTGQDLIDAGFRGGEIDPIKDYQANVWTCAGRTLKLALNPLKPQRLPYQLIPYEKVPHQIWGIGVARQMRDSQETINASVRTMIDNLGIASGPQVEVNQDLLAPGEDPRDLSPWRVWVREGGDSAYPMLRFYQPDSVLQPLGYIADLFRRFADEETSLPSYTHGMSMPGLNKTATGMTMLMDASNVVLKTVVKNVDDYGIRPLVRSMYDWNMRWNPNPMLKMGDVSIKAMGSTSLLMKEQRAQALMQFAQMTANPVDMPMTDRHHIISGVADAIDIPEAMRPMEAMQHGGAIGPQGPAPISGAGLPPGQQPNMGQAGGRPFG